MLGLELRYIDRNSYKKFNELEYILRCDEGKYNLPFWSFDVHIPLREGAVMSVLYWNIVFPAGILITLSGEIGSS